MPLVTKTPNEAVNDTCQTYADKVSASGNIISPNLVSGDPALALFQAVVAAVFMFLQAAAKQIYLFARAATSAGADLDSWMADYGVKRQAAIQAEGIATFSVNRVLGTNITLVPGVVIQTIGGGIQYAVIADTTKSAWSPAANAYVLISGDLQMDVSIKAVNAGTSSNVQVGQLVQFASSVPGFNSVVNQASILNGKDTESDIALRLRFILNIQAPGQIGCTAAYLSAISNVPQITDVSLVEGQNQAGSPVDSFVLIVVDDGSGAPNDLLNSVFLAVNPIRSAGIEIAVVGPDPQSTTVTYNIKVNPAVSAGPIQAQTVINVINYINSLKIGQSLYLSQLDRVIMDTDQVNIIAIEPASLVVNSGTVDIVASARQVFRTDNTKVTVGTY